MHFTWVLCVGGGGLVLFLAARHAWPSLGFLVPALQAPTQLVASPDVIDVGNVENSAPVYTSLRVENRGRSPRRVIGASADCGCLEVRGLPVDVAPDSSATIPIKLQPRKRGSTGAFNRLIAIYFDGPDAMPVVIRVVGSSSDAGRQPD